jgi:hypothetical protein
MKKNYSILTVMLILVACASVPTDSSNLFSYKKYENGDIVITGYRGKDIKVEIPDNIKGAKVVEIASLRNYNLMDKVTTISIPKSVIMIQDNVFSYFSSLKNIILIDDDIESLERLSIINLADVFKYNANTSISFYPERNIKEIIFEDNTTKIVLSFTIGGYSVSRASNDRYINPFFNANLLLNDRRIDGYNQVGRNFSNNINIKKLNNSFIVIHSNSKNDNVLIIKNNEVLLVSKDIDPDSIIIRNNSLYYVNRASFSWDRKLFKNNIVILEKFSDFDIDSSGNYIVHSTFEDNGSMRLFKNNQLIATTNDMFSHLKISPDGAKINYFEVRKGTNQSLLFYARGNEIPPIISGPYLKPNGTGTFVFSKNSRYVACIVESFSRGTEGLYIILNDRLLGPYRRIANDFYFTDDSKFFVYSHDNVESRIEL